MAAPTPTTRVDPSTLGIKLDDGFSTVFTLAVNPSILFWEKTVAPPGIDGGDEIDTSTMFNSTWRTFSPRQLKTLMPFDITAAWDPGVYDQLVTIINVATTGTVTFPDGSTLAFYCFLKTAEPQTHEEGAQPEINLTIVPTNYDPVNNVEAGPVLTNVAGT